uniref:Uncharacterized protein n=1 Tax=Oryza punctata TaxID=4537 RepID=A0A0E0LGW6_ORYPU
MPDGDALVGGGRRQRNGVCVGFLRLRLDIAPMLVISCGYDTPEGSDPLFSINASMFRLMSVGVNSGSGMSPLRYSMTWFILGLDLANGCEHKSPSFSTRHASSMLQFPCSLLSIVSIIDPFCQCSSTKSTNMNRSPCAFCLTGLCPQVISRRNVPNANTSVRGDGLPVRTNSGAR